MFEWELKKKKIKNNLSFEASQSEHGSSVQVSWGSLAAILIFVFQKPWRVDAGNLKVR